MVNRSRILYFNKGRFRFANVSVREYKDVIPYFDSFHSTWQRVIMDVVSARLGPYFPSVSGGPYYSWSVCPLLIRFDIDLKIFY